MEYIDFIADGKTFSVINFPADVDEVQQNGGQILFKKKGEVAFRILRDRKDGYLKLISKVSELDMETIYDNILPYNATQISGKRFIDGFLNSNEVTIDEDLIKTEGLEKYKYLDNAYIFRLRTAEETN